MLWINDDNYQEFVGDTQTVVFDGQERILNAKPRKTTYGEFPLAKKVEDVLPIIPRDQWDDLIAQKDEEETWLEGIVRGVQRCKDQDGLGYCHAYAAVGAEEVARIVMGSEYVELSAESIGGPITGWRNRGANPEDDMEQLASTGACAQTFMDRPNSINPKRWIEGWEANCELHKAVEWIDGDYTNRFDVTVTFALLDIPFHCGFGWWGHAVYGGLRVHKQGRKYGVMYRNSWGPSYGDDGFFYLEEGKGTPDLGIFGVSAPTPSES